MSALEIFFFPKFFSQLSHETMHPRVRDLYKRIITVGRDYPMGLEWVRGKAKVWILQNKDVRDDLELRRKIAEGRRQVREMQAVIWLKRYRYLNKVYKQEET